MKVGIVFGAFDLLHAGHLHLLKQAKKKCDILIVGLHVNPNLERRDKNKPIESILERQFRLEACKYVDNVIVYETEEDLSNILRIFKPDIRFLGMDYGKFDPKNPPEITEEDLVPIEYIDSLPIHTSDLRERIKKA